MGFSAHRDRPRLVDAHVHIRNLEGIASIVSAGIAAVRDAGMKDRSWQGPGRNVQYGNFPVILSAEWALYKKNGYGAHLGVAVDKQDEIKSEILKLWNAGAGIIKVIASGMVSLKEPGRVTSGGFNREELAFIVQEAGDSGLNVMAHANGAQAIIAAAEAGVRSIEHGFFMTGRALEVMAKRKVFWAPTVGALERAADSGNASKEAKAFIGGLISSHLGMIRDAHAGGVPLAVGTDCVLPDPRYRESYDRELAYFEQAGFSREDVLKIACEGGARLLGI